MSVLDAGALIALDRGDRNTWAVVAEVARRGHRPVVPAPVVAQAWRDGRRQARLARLLGGVDQVVIDGALARRAGELLGRAHTVDVLDALVALAAADRPAHEVLTADPGDIHHLLQVVGVRRILREV